MSHDDGRIGRLSYIPPPGKRVGWIWNDQYVVMLSARAIPNAIRAVRDQCEVRIVRNKKKHRFISDVIILNDVNKQREDEEFSSLCTLQQVAVLEALHKRRDHKKERYSFHAGVAAVSPIICMDDTPFCLLEVFQGSHRAICILRGTALAVSEVKLHTEIGLVNVRRQKWRIPSIVPNAPVSVFVVQELQQIIFSNDNHEEDDREDDSVVLHGTIRSVHWLVGGRDEKTLKQLHYLELTDQRFLFVTYFPMSAFSQVSMAVGAEIVAQGLTQIGWKAYAATLRSQIHMVTPSATTLLQDEDRVASLAWKKQVKVSYPELCFKRQLASLLASIQNDAFRTDVPSVEAFMTVMGFTQKLSKRNPYAEFLDPQPPDQIAPSTVSLAQLRHDALSQLLERLQSRGVVTIGWNASFSLDRMGKDNWTLGYLRARVKSGTAFGRLSDGHSETPVVLHESITEIPQHPGYSWVNVHTVFVSCVCIYDAVANYGEPKYQYLPWSYGDSLDGAAALVLMDGRLYLASILIVAHSIRPVGNFYPTTTAPVQCSSVLNYLQLVELPDTPIQGMLVRSWWTATKLKSEVFHGIQITVGHSTGTTNDPKELPLQSLEFKPRIVVDNVKSLVDLLVTFTEGCDIPLDHVSLGAVWRKLADDATLSSLLIGGWDDCQFPNCDNSKVMVWVPADCIIQDPKRGFVRVRCLLDDLTFALRTTANASPNMDGASNKPFLFESRTAKFVVGMLDQRPKRLGLLHEIVISSNNIPGVPVHSILRIFSDLLDDLQTQSRQNLRPSLVRAIPKATFLGISYCRAQASCSKCYSELRQPKRKRLHAVVRGHHHTTTLVCPNGCDVHQFGMVKWECSGTLDDSTGQSKLYAERETALCLIGITKEYRAYVEEGVWRSDGDVVFSKTVPPKSHLKQVVDSARMAARQSLRFGKRKSSGDQKLTEDDVLRKMNPTNRAEYLMEWVCRCQPRWDARQLFLVRCKPLADAVSHVGQTEVQLANENRTTSYTLPPLKLTLVDCVKLV